MAQQDLAGLLTGVGSAPIDPMQGASIRDREIALQQKALGGFRKGVGALTGGRVDARSMQEKAQEALAKLDPTEKEDREKILQIVSRVSPERVPELRAAFAEKDKEEALLSASITSSTETRASIAKQLAKTHPDLAQAIIDERASGQNQALQAGLDIIKERSKPSKGETDPSLVKEYKFAKDSGYEGTFQEFIQSKKSPLVSTVVSPGEKAKAERIGRLFEPLDTVATATQEKALTAVDTKQNALKILSQVEKDANTGTIQGMTSDLVKFAQSAYQMAGMPVPASVTDKMSSKAFYQKLAADGLLPRIAEQGRGFTDTERTFFLNEVLPSYNQTFQFNELAGNMQLVEAQMDLEENGFAQARRAFYVGTDTPPTGTHAEAFSNYLERLPMAKFEKHTRKVGGKDVTYDRMVALQDNAKLYQYWTGGEAPRGFTLPITNKQTGAVEETDLSWGQINALAKKKNTTPRQLLAQAQRTGNLIKAIY